MSDFAKKLRESIRLIKHEWNYYDIQRAILDVIQDEDFKVLDGIPSDEILVCPEGTASPETIDSMLRSSHGFDGIKEKERQVILDAVNGFVTKPRAICVDLADEKILVVSCVSKSKVEQMMMFREKGKQFNRVIEGDDLYGSSSLSSTVSKFYEAAVRSGDAERRELAQNFKMFEHDVQNLRDRRLEDYPELSGDFWDDLETLYRYTDNFEEFNALVAGTNTHNLRDRHLTRLGRATLGLKDNHTEDDLCSGTMYRAVPLNVTEIEAGDWVAVDESYAIDHMRGLEGNGEKSHVISAESGDNGMVMVTDGNEYTYVPEGLWGGAANLKEVWSEMNVENKPERYPSVESMYENKLKASGSKLVL
ncbi:hypothetical protein [Vibrio sp. D431a]|uniref:hypothetical protein n=1 Tax=Vibrio sp. D431a TaxID=2837388 RepID=UPI002554D875|nr:hypothetical protein [Vibrio sp. D431a]MDK9793758.1 hypothetical protein [Vibrio sp. D431a]